MCGELKRLLHFIIFTGLLSFVAFKAYECYAKLLKDDSVMSIYFVSTKEVVPEIMGVSFTICSHWESAFSAQHPPSGYKREVLQRYNISSVQEYIHEKCWDSLNRSTPEQILNEATYTLDDLISHVRLWCPSGAYRYDKTNSFWNSMWDCIQQHQELVPSIY